MLPLTFARASFWRGQTVKLFWMRARFDESICAVGLHSIYCQRSHLTLPFQSSRMAVTVKVLLNHLTLILLILLLKKRLPPVDHGLPLFSPCQTVSIVAPTSHQSHLALYASNGRNVQFALWFGVDALSHVRLTMRSNIVRALVGMYPIHGANVNELSGRLLGANAWFASWGYETAWAIWVSTLITNETIQLWKIDGASSEPCHKCCALDMANSRPKYCPTCLRQCFWW